LDSSPFLCFILCGGFALFMSFMSSRGDLTVWLDKLERVDHICSRLLSCDNIFASCVVLVQLTGYIT
jgi:hypothetical protein